MKLSALGHAVRVLLLVLAASTTGCLPPSAPDGLGVQVTLGPGSTGLLDGLTVSLLPGTFTDWSGFGELQGLGNIPIEAERNTTLVLGPVTLFDGTGAGAVDGRWVVVSQGRITYVGQEHPPEIPGARVVDLSGKFMMPGLWDMHTHPNDEGTFSQFVPAGVTGIRVMWGNPPLTGGRNGYDTGLFHNTWKREIAENRRIGPQMLMASAILDGPPLVWPDSVSVASASDAAQAVAAAREVQADFIKVYGLLRRDVYLAIAGEARSAGLPFAGHVPYSVSIREAMQAGQKTVEHFYGLFEGCLPEATEADLIKRRVQMMEGARDGYQIVDQADKLLTPEVLGTVDPARADSLFRSLAAGQMWVCPTTLVMKSFGAKYGTQAQYRCFESLVPRMRQAGVRFLVGTDQPNEDLQAGASLHDELAEYVRLGFTPAECLRMATGDAARFMGLEASTGTIAVGKAADLLILDASPLDDIRNTRSISSVVVKGLLLESWILKEMAARAAAAAQSASQNSANQYPADDGSGSYSWTGAEQDASY